MPCDSFACDQYDGFAVVTICFGGCAKDEVVVWIGMFRVGDEPAWYPVWYVGACDRYWSDVSGHRCAVVCNWCNGAVGSGLCCLDLHYRISDVDWTIGAYFV